jgi:hypothetical protein
MCWNAALPTLEQLQWPDPATLAGFTNTPAGAKKERRTHGGHQKTIRATKDQVFWGGVRPDRAQLRGHTDDTGCPNRYV